MNGEALFLVMLARRSFIVRLEIPIYLVELVPEMTENTAPRATKVILRDFLQESKIKTSNCVTIILHILDDNADL